MGAHPLQDRKIKNWYWWEYLHRNEFIYAIKILLWNKLLLFEFSSAANDWLVWSLYEVWSIVLGCSLPRSKCCSCQIKAFYCMYNKGGEVFRTMAETRICKGALDPRFCFYLYLNFILLIKETRNYKNILRF
jgi:hypothetical protein